MIGNNPSSFRVFLLIFSILGLFCLIPGHAAALTVTPSTWNIIGLDSNIPAAGSNRFPVGAKVCRPETITNVDATLIWGSVNQIICLRPGSLNPLIILSIAAGICANVFFEVEVNLIASDCVRFWHLPPISHNGGGRPHRQSGDVVTAPTVVLYFNHNKLNPTGAGV